MLYVEYIHFPPRGAVEEVAAALAKGEGSVAHDGGPKLQPSSISHRRWKHRHMREVLECDMKPRRSQAISW
jgi:hypothetical protein